MVTKRGAVLKKMKYYLTLVRGRVAHYQLGGSRRPCCQCPHMHTCRQRRPHASQLQHAT